MLSVVAGAMMSANALANPATVNFNGTVVAPTCTLTADGLTRAVTLNDITAQSIVAAAAHASSSNPTAFNIKGADVSVPAINFEKCPASITKVHIGSVISSGVNEAIGTALYAVPEQGTGRGVTLALGALAYGTSQYVITGAPGDIGNDPDVVFFPVSNGSATTGSDGLRVFAFKSNAVTSIADVTAGNYATTFTVTFDWL
ncbi:fimbrial protein, partial [Enterobacter mori]|uniref:fimbrial protein n=1 Tax=Enterobacter mori TaxID=539813 RepID=UPI003B83C0CA